MTDDITLYLISAVCPNCQHQSRFVESVPEPIDVMQDVTFDATHCPNCGIHIPGQQRDWDVQEESEIERVRPSQEREA